jgi:hypothetical protein
MLVCFTFVASVINSIYGKHLVLLYYLQMTDSPEHFFRDKHSSLLRNTVNGGENSLITFVSAREDAMDGGHCRGCPSKRL